MVSNIIALKNIKEEYKAMEITKENMDKVRETEFRFSLHGKKEHIRKSEYYFKQIQEFKERISRVGFFF